MAARAKRIKKKKKKRETVFNCALATVCVTFKRAPSLYFTEIQSPIFFCSRAARKVSRLLLTPPFGVAGIQWSALPPAVFRGPSRPGIGAGARCRPRIRGDTVFIGRSADRNGRGSIPRRASPSPATAGLPARGSPIERSPGRRRREAGSLPIPQTRTSLRGRPAGGVPSPPPRSPSCETRAPTGTAARPFITALRCLILSLTSFGSNAPPSPRRGGRKCS